MAAGACDLRSTTTDPKHAKDFPMQLEFNAALASLSTTLGLARVAVEARDDAKIRNALFDMSDRLLSVHAAAAHLAAENEKLEAQLRELKEKLVDRQRYVIREVERGRFALAYQPTADDSTPAHYACQACFSAGKKVVMQSINSAYTGWHLSCPLDSAHDIQLSDAAPLPSGSKVA